MRIKINLIAEPGTSIPIEYNYNIHLSIKTRLLEFLNHNKPKLHRQYSKLLPDFTFSQLMIPERKIELGFIEITGNYFSFYVSAIDTDFIQYLVKAFNHSGEFEVHQNVFKIKKIEIVEEPEFTSKMKFRMLSPLLLIKVVNKKAVFVRPVDSDLNEIFSTQTIHKYNALYGTELKPEDISIMLDQNYMERKRSLTRLITIRNIHFKTIFVPMTLSGEPEVIKYAYRQGIGAKTSFGFGMIEKAGK